MEFNEFPKIARLSRQCTITEKIDGTNAQIAISENGEFFVGSRTRWITPQDDNYGFAKWAYEHKDQLMELGPGSHFGEWWGNGIQRNYGVNDKRFWLFNTSKWTETRPACCGVVPVLYDGLFDSNLIEEALKELALHGSKAAPGFMNPEGIIIYHHAANLYFKKTIKKDEEHKSGTLFSGILR